MKKGIWILLGIAIAIGCCAQSQRSNELYARGVELYHTGKYQEAIPFFEECDKLDHAEMDSTDVRVGYAASWLSSCWYKLGEVQKAKEIDNTWYECKPVDRRLTVKADSLFEAGVEAINNHESEKAYELFMQSIKKESETVPFITPNRVITMIFSTLALHEMGRTDEAIEVLHLADMICANLVSDDNPLRIDPMTKAIAILSTTNRYEQTGMEMGALAEFLRNTNQTDTESYWKLMDGALRLTFVMGERDGFVEGYPIVLELTRERYGIESEEYLKELGDITHMLAQMGDSICLEVAPAWIEGIARQHGKDSHAFMRACSTMAGYAAKIGRVDVARKYMSESCELAVRLEPDHPENAYICTSALALTYLTEDMDQALSLAETALQGMEQVGMTNTNYYKFAQYAKGMVLGSKGNYHEGVRLIEASIDFIPSNDSISLIVNKIFLSYFQCMSGKYIEGRRGGLEAIDLLHKEFAKPFMGGVVRGYIGRLDSMIKMYENAHRDVLYTMPDSVKYTYGLLFSELLLLKLEQEERLDSFDTSDFFRTLVQYSVTTHWTKDYLRIRQIVLRYADIMRQQFGEFSWEYDRALDALVNCYEDDDPKKVQLLKQQIEIEMKLYGKRHQVVLAKMEEYYEVTGNQQALFELRKKKIGQNSWKDLTMMTEMLTNKSNNNNESSLRYYRESFKYQLQNNSDFFLLLLSIKGILVCLNNQGKSENLPIECVRIMQQIKSRRPELWNKIVASLHEIELYGVSSQTYEQCVNALIENFEDLKTNPDLQACIVIGKSTYAYFDEQDLDNVAKAYDRAIALAKQNNLRLCDELEINKVKTLYSIDYSYVYKPNPSDIKAIAEKGKAIEQIIVRYPECHDFKEYYEAIAVQLRAALLGHDNQEIVRQCKKLLPGLQRKLKSFYVGGEIERITGQSNWLTREIVSEFSLNELLADAAFCIDERALQTTVGMRSISRQLKLVHDNMASPYSIGSAQEDLYKLMSQATLLAFSIQIDSLICYAYDASIYCKGAMLRSEKLLERHIQEYGNETARQIMKDLKRTAMLMDNAAQNDLGVDSLSKLKDNLEAKLRSMSQMFGDYLTAMQASWVDVKNCLSDRDVAIEFCQFAQRDTSQYCALVLRKNFRYPLLIPLCTDKDIARIKSPYVSDSLAQMIWYPLFSILEDANTVYFSPTGQLHLLAIENLPISKQQKISDKYKVFRLSNTRHLIPLSIPKTQPDAYLVGGVEYELTEAKWDEMPLTSELVHDNTQIMRESLDIETLKQRGALNYLLGTEQEVDNIAYLLHQSGTPVQLAKGTEATETAFKNIVDQQKTIIHIATHGFYTSNSQSSNHDNSEDNVLERSGLLLAGALSYLKGYEIPENVDDGVLTAREVSRLNLTSANLIVLSACETALGDITGEGVFGLQRGFKKAGANSILMSLWKVDDEATCLLMTEFYRNWIGEKMTKHDALEAAKQTVRSHKEKGWDDPKYWAAFILLDGLD